MNKNYFKLLIFILILSIIFISAKNENSLGYIRDLIFPRRKINYYPAIGNDIKLKITNKKRDIYGLLSKNGDKLIVLFHGNGSIINDFEFIAKIFYNNGFSVLLVEYPGYGLAYKFKTTENRIYSDAEFLIKYVQKKYKFDKSKTTMLGWSLGTGVATEMIKRKLGSKLILISAFTSIPDVAHEKYVKVLPYFVIFDRFSNNWKAKSIKSPVLIIHGTKDRMIPYQMSIKLNKSFKNSELMLIQNADHANIFNFLGEIKWKKIFKFIS